MDEIEGTLIHGYEYGAMNRLSKSWNDKGQEAFYLYNGLGQRTGKMQMVMLRIKPSSFEGGNEYLIYGYDEFGNELGEELKEAGIPNIYNRQNQEQPFGYIGYWYDGVSDTYFA